MTKFVGFIHIRVTYMCQYFCVVRFVILLNKCLGVV